MPHFQIQIINECNSSNSEPDIVAIIFLGVYSDIKLSFALTVTWQESMKYSKLVLN